MERSVVIVGGARTPVGKFLGSLSPLTAPQLGAIAIRAALERANLPEDAVDEVLIGNVIQAGIGQAPARQAALQAGIPVSVPATTVNKVCGSGLKAVMFATQALRLGDANIVVAGGMESMSNAPYLLTQARTGYRLGDGTLVDAVVHDGLWCACENQHMGNAAEYIAREFGISRAEQDEFALGSHSKAVSAQKEGRSADEIVPVSVPQRKGALVQVTQDESPRPDTSLEALARLTPAFEKDGSVTAGNAPGLSDGAAALVLTTEAFASERGIIPLARVTGYSSAALEPKRIFAAPALAIRQLLERTGLSLNDFDLLEINEAFAAQILANGKELGWDWSRVNINGGAVALGHPIGATGARILVTLLYALKPGQRGLAALCLGGGGAVAMSIERI